MALWEKFVVGAGALTLIVTFFSNVSKITNPIKNIFHKIQKTENIDKNRNNIEGLSGENKTQNEQIKSLQTDVTGIDKRLGRVENTLGNIKSGVECLLGTSLGLINDPKGSEEIYRNLKKC